MSAVLLKRRLGHRQHRLMEDHQRHSKKVAGGRTGREASENTNPAHALILDLQPPELCVRNKIMLLISHQVYGVFVIADQTD